MRQDWRQLRLCKRSKARMCHPDVGCKLWEGRGKRGGIYVPYGVLFAGWQPMPVVNCTEQCMESPHFILPKATFVVGRCILGCISLLGRETVRPAHLLAVYGGISRAHIRDIRPGRDETDFGIALKDPGGSCIPACHDPEPNQSLHGLECIHPRRLPTVPLFHASVRFGFISLIQAPGGHMREWRKLHTPS
jgi:hypothetical protein